MVLNGPMSINAAPTVRPVQIRRAIQIAIDELKEETCSEVVSSEVEWPSGKTCSVIASPVPVDQVEQGK